MKSISNIKNLSNFLPVSGALNSTSLAFSGALNSHNYDVSEA
jgi:hypothetical protein